MTTTELPAPPYEDAAIHTASVPFACAVGQLLVTLEDPNGCRSGSRQRTHHLLTSHTHTWHQRSRQPHPSHVTSNDSRDAVTPLVTWPPHMPFTRTWHARGFCRRVMHTSDL